jgi:2-polyprenyl-6-methoxyphenol hydroxylase-like FAD-dependent oxidoreductase
VTNRIAISGAGVAGLAAALACKQHGIPFDLFDPAPHPLQGGAALTLWPNALLALQSLLLQPFGSIDFIHPIMQGDVRTGKDEPLYRLPLDWMKNTFGVRPACVRRDVLLDAMWTSLGRPHIERVSTTRVLQSESDDGITLELSDGQVKTYDGVIGAEGVHSNLRKQFVGDHLREANYSAWRGIANDRKNHPLAMREYWGPGVRLGYSDIDETSTYWFATVDHHFLPHTGTTKHDLPIPLLQSSLPARAIELLESTAKEKILHHRVHDYPPGVPINYGNVLLVGDAAHAITPNLGLGAALALEDGLTLQHHLPRLHASTPIDTIFRDVYRSRASRVAMISRATRLLGDLTQSRNSSFIPLRNGLVRSIPSHFTTPVWRYLFRYL